MTSVEKMKMSKLMEHSQNHRTDELYEPLRRALSKSTMPHHLTSLRQSVTPEKVNHSNITHNLRLLSAIEADKIVNNMLVSVGPPSYLPKKNSYRPIISKKLWENIFTQSM